MVGLLYILENFLKKFETYIPLIRPVCKGVIDLSANILQKGVKNKGNKEFHEIISLGRGRVRDMLFFSYLIAIHI